MKLEWVLCPICGTKLGKRDPNNNVKHTGIYIDCKRCKNLIELGKVPMPVPVPEKPA
jgi:hypothetical protein